MVDRFQSKMSAFTVWERSGCSSSRSERLQVLLQVVLSRIYGFLLEDIIKPEEEKGREEEVHWAVNRGVRFYDLVHIFSLNCLSDCIIVVELRF